MKSKMVIMISCYISMLIVSFKIVFMNNCVNWSHLLKDAPEVIIRLHVHQCNNLTLIIYIRLTRHHSHFL